MNQVEFLLRLAENAQEEGNDIARRHNEERDIHTKKLKELWRMIELARGNVWNELKRFGAADVQESSDGRREAEARAQVAARTLRMIGEKDADGAGNRTRDAAR